MSTLVELIGGSDLRIDARLSAEELAADLHRAAGIPRREGGTVITYLDKDFLLTRPSLLRRVARQVAEIVPDGIDRLASTAGMSLLLGTAVSLEVGLPLVVVDGQRVRGARYPGEVVAPIEDVLRTGATALSTVEVLRSAGLVVNDVVAAVDRVSGAALLLAAHDITVRALFDMPMGAA